MTQRSVETKDSGQRESFETGSRRDTQDGKPRFDLIPIDLLDKIQQILGGAPLTIDSEPDPIVGFVETDPTNPNQIPDVMLNRMKGLYERGEIKYGRDNWKLGQPVSRVYASALRHLIQWAAGDTSEDHLAAVIWNVTAIMYFETAVSDGTLPRSLLDFGASKGYVDWMFSEESIMDVLSRGGWYSAGEVAEIIGQPLRLVQIVIDEMVEDEIVETNTWHADHHERPYYRIRHK